MSASFHPSLVSLLESLSAAVGERVELNAQGQCCLEFDGRVVITIAQAGDPDILSLRSTVSAERQPMGSELLQLALSLNYTVLPPGYSLALDTASGKLVLIALVDTVEASQENFLRLVAGFLELVPELRERCGTSSIDWHSPASAGLGASA